MNTRATPAAIETAMTVVDLPRALKRRADVSPFSLLQHSGYCERRSEITTTLLREMISRDPTVVNDWVGYSEEKRSSSGHFLRKQAAGYDVGYLCEDRREVRLQSYVSGVDACAVFIKKEVEEMSRADVPPL
jgi:hypothetical protein